MSIIATVLAAAVIPAPPTCNKIDVNLNPATLAFLRRVDNPAAQKIAAPKAGYARIVARYASCNVDSSYLRQYDTEKRDIIRRFFMHKEVSKILTAKVAVRPLGVTGSAPLMSMGRDSGKQGETWSTDVGNSLTILPYFRIEPNTILQLTASYDSQRTYTSSIAGDVIDIIDRATKLITPTTPLITASNKNRFNDAATFIDTTISGLLKVDIQENLRADSPIGDGDTVLAQLVLYATGANDPYQRKPKEYERPVGMWTIAAETFSGSLFTGDQNNNAIPSVAAVLNFQVTDGKKIREMLAGDTLTTTARDAFGKTTDAGKKSEAAGALCRAVASKADAEGFSSDDVKWIVAAYIADMAPNANAAPAGCPFVGAIKRIYGNESENQQTAK
jgi:hypothetical protein